MTVIRPIDVAVKAAVKKSSSSPRYLTRSLWTAALVLGLSIAQGLATLLWKTRI